MATKSPEARFIEEYLVDRDPVQAALRAGVARINVKKKVQQWMSDPGILAEIKKCTDESEPAEMITPQRIIAGWMDIAFDKSANHSARNAALKELATFKDMYPKKEEKDDEDPPLGVMLVPVGPNLEQWEKLATKMQQKLKDDVKS